MPDDSQILTRETLTRAIVMVSSDEYRYETMRQRALNEVALIRVLGLDRVDDPSKQA